MGLAEAVSANGAGELFVQRRHGAQKVMMPNESYELKDWPETEQSRQVTWKTISEAENTFKNSFSL